MDLDYSPKVEGLRRELESFMTEFVYPNESAHAEEERARRADGHTWTRHSARVDALKLKGRERGLWNLFLPSSARAPQGLSNLE